MGGARGDPPFRLRRGEVAIGARIERCAIRVARPAWPGGGGDNLGPAHECRVDQVHGLEARQSRGVGIHMLRLAADRFLPRQPEPGEVREDRRLVFRAAAGRVDVLDAQQEAPVCGAAGRVTGERRKGVAEVQFAVRRGREAEDALQRQSVSGLKGSGPCFSRQRFIWGEDQPCRQSRRPTTSPKVWPI